MLSNKIESEEYKEESVSSPEQDSILFSIYCVVMRTTAIGERHFRLYIGNGNWVTLPQHISDDLQTIYKNGLPIRYSLAPGLALDILPNDMDCNSRTACLPGLMRVDLCYSGHPNNEAGQQALSLYVKQLLENQGTMDAFPPPTAMRCTKEHLGENGEEKEETTGDALTLPHVLSLPSHRHLSLVPPLPPSGPGRRRLAVTPPSPRYHLPHALKAGKSVTPQVARKRSTALLSHTKRRKLHNPTTQSLTTGSTGPEVPQTMIHHLHHHHQNNDYPEDVESSHLFSPPPYCCENNSTGDNMMAAYRTSPPATLWPYIDQAPSDMVQYNGVNLPVGYFSHHHVHPLTPGEHPSVTTTPGNTSSSMVTTLSYPLSDLSSPPESVTMRHNSMNADIETQYGLENMLQSQLNMVDSGYL